MRKAGLLLWGGRLKPQPGMPTSQVGVPAAVPDLALPVQLPADAPEGSRDGWSSWVPGTCVGDPGGASGISLLGPGSCGHLREWTTREKVSLSFSLSFYLTNI